ncbi:rhodanese-like domain-containing protein [Candidatus Saccharibacteria bacterium]|nr:rhodanese-like domain-containing protein [Candidatus Saccharibacteria bacterium]
MRKIIIVIAIVTVAGGVIVGVSLGRGGEESTERAPAEVAGVSEKGAAATPELTFEQIQDDIASGAKFYDVRRSDEYAAGYFVGAENWPIEDIEAGELPDLPHDSKIYLHCRSGARSARATEILEKAGFTNIIDLHGLADIEKIGGELVAETVE